jgi:hypothetical protein
MVERIPKQKHVQLFRMCHYSFKNSKVFATDKRRRSTFSQGRDTKQSIKYWLIALKLTLLTCLVKKTGDLLKTKHDKLNGCQEE